MKKVKLKTPVPLPGAKSKSLGKEARPPSNSSQLSKEYVESSDDSSMEAPSKQTPARKPDKEKTPMSIGVHRLHGNSISKKAPTKSLVPPPPVSKKSTHEEREASSTDSDDSDDSAAKSAQKHADQMEREMSDDGESSDDDSSASSQIETVANGVHNVNARQSQSLQPNTYTGQARPVQPYRPPNGFTACSTPPSATSSSAARLFENTEGKQIWHITAPAGVPLTQVKEVILDRALQGEAIMQHNGLDYGFSTEENEGSTRDVLIPHQNGYRALGTKISRTLHLQQVIRIPSLSQAQADPNTGSEAAASITRSTIRTPRVQRKGLRMHYFPTGFGDGDGGVLGSSDSENEAMPTAGLGIPNSTLGGTQHPTKGEKRKHAQVYEEEAQESPKKKKKHREERTPEEIRKREEKKARKERKRQKQMYQNNH